MSKKDLKPLEWHTEQRVISELVPYGKNPRKLTDEKKAVLQRSIEKFNFVEIPVINLDNTLIAGHQRLTVMTLLGRGDETTDVRVPNRLLSEAELKEYNVQSNVSIGDWDLDVLSMEFSDLNFQDMGLDSMIYERNPAMFENIEAKSEKMTDKEFVEKFNEIKDDVAKMPIVPEFFEHYECFIIPVHNEIDENFIREVFGIVEAHVSAENKTRICRTNVISIDKIREAWIK